MLLERWLYQYLFEMRARIRSRMALRIELVEYIRGRELREFLRSLWVLQLDGDRPAARMGPHTLVTLTGSQNDKLLLQLPLLPVSRSGGPAANGH